MRTARHLMVVSALMAASFFHASTEAVAAIVDTKHNLSVSGPGPIKSTIEREICIFCHAPHNARRDVPYLWNRPDSTANYTTYQSSTLYATVGQPTGTSKLCLSCHDGTIALGALVSRPAEVPFAGGLRFIPEGPSRLGTDLSDDHPISFVYNDALVALRGELASPSTLVNEVKLDASGEMQCTACHNPHDNPFGKFLVKPNNFADICVTCHVRTEWPIASHATSTKTWNGTLPDPWPRTSFTNVAENACESCHTPHTAGGHARLLNFAIEEDNCLTCHTGNVAQHDIEAELIKSTGHKVQQFVGIHDPAEDFSVGTTNHVECVDCHNPHRANDIPASAPLVPGPLRGVKGVDISGQLVNEATNLYEVCFKCHADNNVTNSVPITRMLPQINTRLEFDVVNPSFHPVAFPGKNPDVPSLIPPLNENSMIYCTDCHNNNEGPGSGIGGSGPAGPHGSNEDFLLERNYSVRDFTQESSTEYALCYKCHDRDSIRGDDSFKEHDKHIRGEDAPCSACHDPHGVSATQGNPTNNSHLINFDINIVTPSSSGQLRFEDLGNFRGRCWLTCHGENHNPEEYP